MTTLYHQVWIDAPVANVYSAVVTAEGLGRWWAPHTSTETAAGLVLAHNPGEAHGEVRMKVLATEHSEFLGFCNFAWGETLLMLKQWCESR